MPGPPRILAHPSHGSWPRRELHRRPQRQGPHAGTATHFGTPLRRFVAPYGAPPKAVPTTRYSQLRMAGSFARMM
eukprot:2396946-Pyramimonas_sp.AAC.1